MERLQLSVHPEISAETILRVVRMETDPNYFYTLSFEELREIAATNTNVRRLSSSDKRFIDMVDALQAGARASHQRFHWAARR